MGNFEHRIKEDSTEFEKAFLKIYDGNLWTALDKMKDWQAPSKPIVVPRCVAEWFRGLSYNSLEKYILNDVRKMNEKEVYLFTDFEKWFIASENPIETILKMKDGYEVEEK